MSVLYSHAVYYLQHKRPDLRAPFTRDWFLYGRSPAVLQLAMQSLIEIANSK
jgi:hypothetical protein